MGLKGNAGPKQDDVYIAVNAVDEPDAVRILLLGDSDVGKSTFLS